MNADVDLTTSAAAPPGIRDDKVAFVRRMRARRDQGRRLRVVVIVALWAGVAACGWVGFQNFVVFGCRSKQSEAKSLLKRVVTLQQAAMGEGGRFEAVVDERPADTRKRYRLVPGRLTATSFEAFAVGLEPEGDLWRVTDHSPVEHVHDACAR